MKNKKRAFLLALLRGEVAATDQERRARAALKKVRIPEKGEVVRSHGLAIVGYGRSSFPPIYNSGGFTTWSNDRQVGAIAVPLHLEDRVVDLAHGRLTYSESESLKIACWRAMGIVRW